VSGALDAYAIWSGINAEFCAGYLEGRDPETPEPNANRHPAYRHSWEVGRAEKEGWVIPASFSRKRAAEIEAGGEFYPYAKLPK
jgi:hypothetical protein